MKQSPEYRDSHMMSIITRYHNWVGTEGMLLEHKWAHIAMANGKNGSTLETGNARLEGDIRSIYYPNYPDEFFQQLCDYMNWPWNEGDNHENT